MVRNNVASALIFEDDVDWDVVLKKQLVLFARGSRFPPQYSAAHGFLIPIW